jgi:hypothetical protein
MSISSVEPCPFAAVLTRFGALEVSDADEPFDLEICVRRSGATTIFLAERRLKLRIQDLPGLESLFRRDLGGRFPLVLTSRLTFSTLKRCAEAGINCIDARGNAHIVAENLICRCGVAMRLL